MLAHSGRVPLDRGYGCTALDGGGNGTGGGRTAGTSLLRTVIVSSTPSMTTAISRWRCCPGARVICPCDPNSCTCSRYPPAGIPLNVKCPARSLRVSMGCCVDVFHRVRPRRLSIFRCTQPPILRVFVQQNIQLEADGLEARLWPAKGQLSRELIRRGSRQTSYNAAP